MTEIDELKEKVAFFEQALCTLYELATEIAEVQKDLAHVLRVHVETHPSYPKEVDEQPKGNLS